MPANAKCQSRLRLPLKVWSHISEQLDRPHQIVLGSVCRGLRALMVPKLYKYAVLSEWNDEGLKFFEAIERKIICEDVVHAIQKVELQVLSRDGSRPMLAAFERVSGLLSNLETLSITSYWFEDALAIVNELERTQTGGYLFEIRCRSGQSLGSSLLLEPAVLSKISFIMAPTLYVSVMTRMDNLKGLEVEFLVHDEASAVHVVEPEAPSSSSSSLAPPKKRKKLAQFLEHAHISYADWVALGRPRIKKLDLELGPNYLYRQHARDVEKQHVPFSKVQISDACIEELKLIGASAHLKQRPTGHAADISVICDGLRVLMACELDEFTVERLFTNLKCPKLEFVSVLPVTAGALRGLLTGQANPHLCLAMVTDASYKWKSEEEVSRLVRWLQSAASQFPIDLRDTSGTIDREIVFGEGLWRNIQQTQFGPLALRALK